MSRFPHPISLTAAMLAHRQWIMTDQGQTPMPHQCQPLLDARPMPMAHLAADLASRLHRLAKGAARASMAECNGEMWPGQRAWAGRNGEYIAAEIEKYANRIDRAISKLNADLAPLAIEARRNGDPRGFAIKLRSTDPTRPLPSNEQGGEWGIA